MHINKIVMNFNNYMKKTSKGLNRGSYILDKTDDFITCYGGVTIPEWHRSKRQLFLRIN